MQQIEEGKVINITDYGVFVKVQSGKKGLVHINEMSKAQKNKFKKLYKPKQSVTVRVLEQLENNRLKLSFKLDDQPSKPKKKVAPIAVVPTIEEDEITPIQKQLQKLARVKVQRQKKSTKMTQQQEKKQTMNKQKSLPLTGQEFEQRLSQFLSESYQRLEILSQKSHHE